MKEPSTFKCLKILIDYCPSIKKDFILATVLTTFSGIFDVLGIVSLPFLLSVALGDVSTPFHLFFSKFTNLQLFMFVVLILGSRYIVILLLYRLSIIRLQTIRKKVGTLISDALFLQQPGDGIKEIFNQNRVVFGEFYILVFSGFLGPLNVIYSEILIVMLLTICLAFFNLNFLLLLIALSIFIAFFLYLQKKYLNAVGAKKAEIERNRLILLENTMTGLITLYLHDKILEVRKKYNLSLHNLIGPDVSFAVNQFRVRPGLELLIYSIIFSMPLLHEVNESSITQYTFIIFATFRLLPSIGKLLNSSNSLAYGDKAIKEICKFLDQNPKLKNGLQSTNDELESLKIIFKDKIGNETYLELRRGNAVRILGPTGTGKSILVKTLLGVEKHTILEPTVYINGKIEANLFRFRSKIGYVSQDPFILDGTIEWNLTLGDPSYSKKEVNNVLKLVNLKNLDISATQLSGGQKQKLCIARELLRSPQILIFDEATSALDYRSEKMIFDLVSRLLPKIIFIFIKHGRVSKIFEYSTLDLSNLSKTRRIKVY